MLSMVYGSDWCFMLVYCLWSLFFYSFRFSLCGWIRRNGELFLCMNTRLVVIILEFSFFYGSFIFGYLWEGKSYIFVAVFFTGRIFASENKIIINWPNHNFTEKQKWFTDHVANLSNWMGFCFLLTYGNFVLLNEKSDRFIGMVKEIIKVAPPT